MFNRPSAERVFAFGLAALCLAACYREAIVGWSDRLQDQRSLTSLDRASLLVPQNATLMRDRGILRLDADPQAARHLLERAIELNPLDSDALIGLGLLDESAGQLQRAEGHLTRAVSLSGRFRPKFALAFFYARQRLLDRFWPAAAVAANVDHADPEPLFSVAHRVSSDAERVADGLNLKSQHALLSYLQFLSKQEGPTPIGRIALSVEPTAQSRALLLKAVDRLISQNRSGEAVQVWNRLNSATPQRRLAPNKGASLSNSQFAAAERCGFDWRPSHNPGIDLREGAPGDLRIEFSGHQPESAILLEQFVPVVPGKDYRFSFAHSTVGLNGSTDLSWQVFEADTVQGSAPVDAVPQGLGTLSFRTTPNASLVRIALRYARSLGSVRLEGVVTLRSAKLELL